MTDSFPGFARKLHVAMTKQSGASTPSTIAARLEFCNKKNIQYNSAAVHRTLLIAAVKYVEVVDARTHQKFMRLVRRFGRDALTGKWNNLNRVLQSCCKELESASELWSGLTAADLVCHFVDYLMWALENEEVACAAITHEWLDKARAVMQHFASYSNYQQTFATGALGASTHGESQESTGNT